MKIKLISITFITLFIISCGKPTEVKPNKKVLLAQALYLKNFNSVQGLLKQVKLSENTLNLINANKAMHQGSEPGLQKELRYLHQFYSQMSPSHQVLYNQMRQWLLLKQIYRTEIAPPVRILQRKELYLAPSNINFNVCQTTPARCASEQRTELAEFITKKVVAQELKKMALKDPCANLSNSLKDSTFANRCLNSSKGDLRIELLAKPFLTQSKWLQVMSNE
jgi:hypothetical protein